VAVWLLFGSMIGFVLSVTGQLRARETAAVSLPIVIVLALECLGPWYYLRFRPLRSTAPWKLVATYVLAAISMSAVVGVVVHITVAALSGVFPNLEDRLHPVLPALAGMVILIYLLSIALHYVLFAIESSRQAELLSREAELKALKAQVNPHFLFNSLNSISALTSLDPYWNWLVMRSPWYL
jgi:two-component system, LytTR family, sensor histidine kinase AlgZ